MPGPDLGLGFHRSFLPAGVPTGSSVTRFLAGEPQTSRIPPTAWSVKERERDGPCLLSAAAAHVLPGAWKEPDSLDRLVGEIRYFGILRAA